VVTSTHSRAIDAVIKIERFSQGFSKFFSEAPDSHGSPWDERSDTVFIGGVKQTSPERPLFQVFRDSATDRLLVHHGHSSISHSSAQLSFAKPPHPTRIGLIFLSIALLLSRFALPFSAPDLMADSPAPPAPDAEPLKWITCRWVGNQQNLHFVIEVTGNETIPELLQLLRREHGIDAGIAAFSVMHLTTERLCDIPDLRNFSELRIEPAPVVKGSRALLAGKATARGPLPPLTEADTAAVKRLMADLPHLAMTFEGMARLYVNACRDERSVRARLNSR
jgi:hypothetical protein